MDTPSTWKCPGCGAIVELPARRAAGHRCLGEKRLDQIARAVCGCWIAEMSEVGFDRLLEALTAGAGARGLPRNSAHED